MASHLLACDGSLLSHYPSLITAVSLSSISYALHVAIAVSTLVILAKKLFINSKDHRLVAHLLFVLLLLVLATTHLSVYLATRTVCNRKLRIASYDARFTLLETCLSEIRVPGEIIPPTESCWALTGPDPSASFTGHSEYESITGHRFFNGPSFDLNRAQDILALVVAVLAQSYLVGPFEYTHRVKIRSSSVSFFRSFVVIEL
ncbi:hypothetical protein BDV98DRAFT_337227 [Pterulicium gracile]|uniref:Uncharacterized protein n=1 Tax=Pterulicium gracile TaxID=1884261 RepID=A0A5C3Q7R1_9AGAR|nr:hypothetical protein BDV98DRAFT_337227 [Pterula gracilis]